MNYTKKNIKIGAESDFTLKIKQAKKFVDLKIYTTLCLRAAVVHLNF